MSKAIVRIDIPDDYADEYKEWLIEGTLYYLEDGAWMYFKDAEYFVEPYREAIPIERIEKLIAQVKGFSNDNPSYWCVCDVIDREKVLRAIEDMLEEWEKENEQNKENASQAN